MSWGNPQSVSERTTAAFLSPLSFFYSLGNRINALSYRLNIQKRYRPTVPVISIGNITVGGTGKTPLVIEIAQQLCAQGLKVGIASRGYKRESSAPQVIAGDGNGNFAEVCETGDEPYLIAHSVPQAVVITASNRALAAATLVKTFRCDVIILDDGFQHYRVERDLDIVLIDYSDHPGNDQVLPAGRLREELTGLSRADHIVITKVPPTIDQNHWQYLQSTLAQLAPNKGISACRFKASKLVHFKNDSESLLTPASLTGVKVVAFSGIARPEPFVNSLKQLGAQVVAEKQFSDHHPYTARDLAVLSKMKNEHSAQYLVTTAKDAAKLPRNSEFDALVLEQSVEWLTAPPTSLHSLVAQIKSANFSKSDRSQFLDSSNVETNAVHSK